MSPSSSGPPEPHALQPILDDAEDELRRRLREACVAEAKGVSTESTQEMRRLEDVLLAAAIAAKQTIAVRRHVKRNAPEERERPITINEAADRKRGAGSQAEESFDDSLVDQQSERLDTRVREFTDDTGRAWRAWPVTPGLTRLGAVSSEISGMAGFVSRVWIARHGAGFPAGRQIGPTSRMTSSRTCWGKRSARQGARASERIRAILRARQSAVACKSYQFDDRGCASIARNLARIVSALDHRPSLSHGTGPELCPITKNRPPLLINVGRP